MSLSIDFKFRTLFFISTITTILGIMMALESGKPGSDNLYFTLFLSLNLIEKLPMFLLIMLLQEYVQLWILDSFLFGFLAPLNFLSEYQIINITKLALLLRFIPGLIGDLSQQFHLGEDKFSVILMIALQLRVIAIYLAMNIVQSQDIEEEDSPIDNLNISNQINIHHNNINNQVQNLPDLENNQVNLVNENSNNNSFHQLNAIASNRNNIENAHPIQINSQIQQFKQELKSKYSIRSQCMKEAFNILCTLLFWNSIILIATTRQLCGLTFTIAICAILSLFDLQKTKTLKSLYFGFYCHQMYINEIKNQKSEDIFLNSCHSQRSFKQSSLISIASILTIAFHYHHQQEGSYNSFIILSLIILILQVISILIRLPLFFKIRNRIIISYCQQNKSISHLIAQLSNSKVIPGTYFIMTHDLQFCNNYISYSSYSYLSAEQQEQEQQQKNDQEYDKLINIILLLAQEKQCQILIQSLIFAKSNEYNLLDSKFKFPESVQLEILKKSSYIPLQFISMKLSSQQMKLIVENRINQGILFHSTFRQILFKYQENEKCTQRVLSIMSSFLSSMAFRQQISHFLPLHPGHLLYELQE